MANLASVGGASTEVAARTVVIAVLSNTLVKGCIASFLGSPELRRIIAPRRLRAPRRRAPRGAAAAAGALDEIAPSYRGSSEGTPDSCRRLLIENDADQILAARRQRRVDAYLRRHRVLWTGGPGSPRRRGLRDPSHAAAGRAAGPGRWTTPARLGAEVSPPLARLPTRADGNVARPPSARPLVTPSGPRGRSPWLVASRVRLPAGATP